MTEKILIPKTSVGQFSMRLDKPFKKIWCRNMMVSEFRKIEFTSSCVQGGFCELAAILKGLRKQEINKCSCSTYSSSASTILRFGIRKMVCRLDDGLVWSIYRIRSTDHLLGSETAFERLENYFLRCLNPRR